MCETEDCASSILEAGRWWVSRRETDLENCVSARDTGR
jgi:hypothetical protein